MSCKALRHGSHSFTCNYTNACLYLVNIHQMAPPQTEQKACNQSDVNNHENAAYTGKTQQIHTQLLAVYQKIIPTNLSYGNRGIDERRFMFDKNIYIK